MPAVSPVPDNTIWFKSSYSGGNATECVEATLAPKRVLIRDSKQPQESVVGFQAQAWNVFVQAVTRGIV